MAQEMELHLRDKFLNGLESNSKFPRYNQFQHIKSLLEEMFRSSTPADPSVIRDKLYKLNNLLTECKMLSRKHGFNSPEELMTINRIRRDLRQIKKEIKAINKKEASNRGSSTEKRDTGDSRISSSQDRDISRWTTRAVDATKVYGFDDEVLSMENLLLKKGNDVHQFKAVGIVGRDGIGKTTLCQLMFNKEEVRKDFNPRIWVCMARHPDEDKDDDLKVEIVKRMLKYLGVEEATIKLVCDAKPGLEGLLCALYLKLLGKRYLIVLDDARETDSWYKELDSSLTHDTKWSDRFAFGFPKDSGGRVIVTSRNEELANNMVGKENVHHLEPMLDDESCWKIFKDSVDKDLLSTIPSPMELKLEVKQKCGGLPLAAKMMGQAMQQLEEERIRMMEQAMQEQEQERTTSHQGTKDTPVT